MNVLVCLISGERMQNVLPLFQKGWDFKHVIGLVSGNNEQHDAKYMRTWEQLKETLHDRAEWELWLTPLPSTDFEAAYTACQKIIEDYGADQVTVNFTGGTKPMAFGAYRAALEKGASLLYVDTESERFYIQQPQAEPKYLPFNLQPITVRYIINLQGRQIDESRITNKGYDNFLSLGREMLEDRTRTINEFRALQQRMPIEETQLEITIGVTEIPVADWAIELLRRHKMISLYRDLIIVPLKTIHFLKGGWLEIYAFTAIHESSQFMDVLSPLAITQFRDEIDVAVVYQGKMGIVECKTGNLKGKTGTAALKQLYEFRTKLTGPFGKAFLVTSWKGSLSHLEARARDYISPIIVIANDDLLRVEEIILEGMMAH